MNANVSKMDQWVIIRFITLEGCKGGGYSLQNAGYVWWYVCIKTHDNKIGRNVYWQATTDLLRSSLAHKVVTEKPIIHIDIDINRSRHKNVYDVTVEFSVSIGTVHNIAHDQLTSFFPDRIHNLPEQWNTCINAMGDFFFTNFLCISLIKCCCFYLCTCFISVPLHLKSLSFIPPLHLSYIYKSKLFKINI